ncbi:MAG TPA: ATP-grasp domain-containing protein [Planctomycetaceae bacterium]|nr:ATP-grasp domain-containing protein [Planctomycetaceae bacterium]
MRVFISEYVCGGGWPENEVAGSLATEGRSMLAAVVEDFARIAGVRVATTWDARLGPFPVRGVFVVITKSPADELHTFRKLAAECDATLVIAPEFHGILKERCEIVEECGIRLIGPRVRAVALCADKLKLADHLHCAGIPTIATNPLILASAFPVPGRDGSTPFPVVVKPRDGAGSQDVSLVDSAEELERLSDHLAQAAPRREFVWQRFVPGRALSVAMIFSPSRAEVEVFPPAEQILSDNRTFRYLGGRVPATAIDGNVNRDMALEACRCVPGLSGYVGVDLIVPEDSPQRPVVVEINPRLTTSYLGYRALAKNNLAEWMLIPSRFQRPIRWRKGPIEFDAAGKSFDGRPHDAKEPSRRALPHRAAP